MIWDVKEIKKQPIGVDCFSEIFLSFESEIFGEISEPMDLSIHLFRLYQYYTAILASSQPLDVGFTRLLASKYGILPYRYKYGWRE